jgi:hypothetical protein
MARSLTPAIDAGLSEPCLDRTHGSRVRVLAEGMPILCPAPLWSVFLFRMFTTRLSFVMARPLQRVLRASV